MNGKKLFFLTLLLLGLLFTSVLHAQSDDVLTAALRANPTAVSLDGQTRVQLTLSADSANCPITVSATPLDVVLVLDQSGSMSGRPWEATQNAANAFIGQMNFAQDRVGVVLFAGNATLAQGLTDNATAAQTAVRNGNASGGGTDIADGLERGGEELVRNGRSDNASRVLILLSDGGSGRSAAMREAETYKDAGVRIITIGLGDGVDESFLRDVASDPVTDYYSAPNSEELSAIYESIAESIQESAGVTNISVNHTFDNTNFELVPTSISSGGAVNGNTISWEMATLADGDLVSFSYRLRPLQPGTFNASSSTNITFRQCETDDRSLTLGPGPEVIVPAPPPPPVVTPDTISGETCEDGCVEQIVRVQVPAVDSPLVVNQLDVVFLMDVSGSMGDELDVVKRESNAIMEGLRDLVADTNFAIATFADYPGFSDSRYGGPYGDAGDYPWQADQDLTADTNLVSRAISRVGLLDGQDVPEAYTRALYETQFLSWRPDARRIVILFGDAIPHDRNFFGDDYGVDPGRDGRENTADDLQLRQVVTDLASANVSVIAVDTQDGEEPEVTRFFRYVAEETDGQYFRLGTAEQIPEAIQTLVGGQIASISQLMLTAADPYRTWLELSPASHANVLYDGRILEFRVRICPGSGGAERGDYTFDLMVVADEVTVATIPTTVTYRPVCLPPVDLFVADNLNDEGIDCSNLTGEPFWESPDIIVRQRDDNGHESQPPRPGEPNYIYVQVHNRGYQDVNDVNVHLYWVYSSLSRPDDVVWYDLGSIDTVVPGEGQTWTPAFVWTPPDAGPFSFLVRVESVEDPVTKPDDVACDNNLALNNNPVVALTVPSLYAGSLGGQLILPLTGDGLTDLIVDLSERPSDTTLSLTLGDGAFSSWSGVVEGGVVDGNRVTAGHGSTLILRDLPLSGETPNQLVWCLTSAEDEPISIPVRLRAAGTDITGMTLIGQPEQPVLPGIAPEITPVPIVRAESPPLSYIAPLVLLTLLFVGLLSWLLVKQ